MNKMLAVYRKELRQISRDRRTLMTIVFVPAFFLLLYGYALNFDIRHIALVVQATLDVPSFLSSEPGVDGFPQFAADGIPEVRGRHPVRITVTLPRVSSVSRTCSESTSLRAKNSSRLAGT